MSTLEVAIAYSATKHAGQTDKAGHPYILHPLHVMSCVNTLDEKIVAVLHDVLEDTDATPEKLYELGFPLQIVQAIQALTKRPGESRINAAKRTAQNKLATIVKLADVAHNMDIKRLKVISKKDLDRLEEYKLVQNLLEEALKNNV